jgi:hypothetical protein
VELLVHRGLGVHVAVAVHVKVNENVNEHGPCSLS